MSICSVVPKTWSKVWCHHHPKISQCNISLSNNNNIQIVIIWTYEYTDSPDDSLCWDHSLSWDEAFRCSNRSHPNTFSLFAPFLRTLLIFVLSAFSTSHPEQSTSAWLRPDPSLAVNVMILLRRHCAFQRFHHYCFLYFRACCWCRLHPTSNSLLCKKRNNKCGKSVPCWWQMELKHYLCQMLEQLTCVDFHFHLCTRFLRDISFLKTPPFPFCFSYSVKSACKSFIPVTPWNGSMLEDPLRTVVPGARLLQNWF